MALSEQAKQAQREYMREWKRKNRERYNAYMREWREENSEKVKQYNENYWNKKAAELERGEKIASG